jgi:hypothetical protein
MARHILETRTSAALYSTHPQSRQSWDLRAVPSASPALSSPDLVEFRACCVLPERISPAVGPHHAFFVLQARTVHLGHRFRHRVLQAHSARAEVQACAYHALQALISLI